MNWKDETSYARGDKERKPRVLALIDDPLRLKVHRWHGIDGVWFASCDLFDRRELAEADLESAKAEAISLVLRKLAEAMAFYSTPTN